jgi:hypothetical protein
MTRESERSKIDFEKKTVRLTFMRRVYIGLYAIVSVEKATVYVSAPAASYYGTTNSFQ